MTIFLTDLQDNANANPTATYGSQACFSRRFMAASVNHALALERQSLLITKNLKRVSCDRLKIG